MEDEYAIGLDLGTTFSCIGVYRKGGVEIIPNSIGEKITPSVVVFKGNDILVGEDTNDYLVKDYKNCIYEVKRLIGIDFTKEKDKNKEKEKEKELKEEIEKLPFKVVRKDKNTLNIKVEGKKDFSPAEISSLIIKKMIQNASKYLNKTIKKLVITVPAYFKEPQKALTRQAAEMLGLEVIRIINEPTAAALAYGFTNEKLEDKNILVFDLGGGTFDVSILAFETEKVDDKKVKNLKVLASAGDMHLGGEDFDNALVDYIINKQNIQKEMKGNAEARKKLKVACEKAKKRLSQAQETTIRVNNCLGDKDIDEKITREEFETVCESLFERLENPINDAISASKISKENINEIILVGGSTRIPKVKQFIKDFFGEKVKINDSINPDEAVAYGATLQAEKILYNNDLKISNFHILDINPFSLGISVKNESEDKKIQEEGEEMSVIIQRGSILPISNVCNYKTVVDNQTTVSIKIYEGEKKYVKYNHLIKETTIEGLTPKPKVQTKISVEFKIDVNGLLTVKAVETSEKEGKSINLTIKNDEICFSEEKMKTLKQNMDEMVKRIKNKKLTEDMDYTNLKKDLKMYLDAFKECKDDEIDDKKDYLNNFNEVMEEFINKFDKNFDNETVLEKHYLYIKELFLSSYLEYLKLNLPKGEKVEIFKKIEFYLNYFIDKSSGYLSNLLEVLSPLQTGDLKKEFYKIVINIMEKLNNCGKERIKKNNAFFKYHSLMYFEQSLHYYDIYLSKVNRAKFEPKSLKKMEEQKNICISYINNIKSGAILLVEESLIKDRKFDEKKKIFESINSGVTDSLNKLGILYADISKNTEQILSAIKEYEKVLASIKMTDNPTEIELEAEAKCIASILKLNQMLGGFDPKKKYLFSLADRCKDIIGQLNISDTNDWCKEFLELYKNIQKLNTPNLNYPQLLEKVKQRTPKDFDELEREFDEHKGTIKFIEYLLKKHPYVNYESDKENKVIEFDNYTRGLLLFLMKKYQAENYAPGNEKSEKSYCLKNEISSKLSNLMNKIQNK